MTDYTYFVSGKAYARIAGADAGFEWPGLIDTIEISVQQNVIQLPDSTQPGGGVYKEIRRIESMTMTMNHREFKPETLARALFGASTGVNAAAVADEAHTAYLGGFVPLEHPGTYTSLTVTDDTTAKNVIDPENYDIVPGGIQITEDAPDIDTNGTDILVNYTHPAYDRVQALVESAPELEIHFAGRNEARDDKEVNVRLHKVRLGATETLSLLSSDDFGSLSLTGEVLKDLTKTGNGESQYFYEDIVR